MRFTKHAIALSLALSATLALAQDYPKNTVKLVVGFAPGGSVDLMARTIGQKLQDRLGQPFIVDNKPGSGGNLGANFVAKAKPDGYTLLVTSVVHSINPSLFASLPFDTARDFEPVASIGLAPNGISVNPNTPFKTLGELVTYAKANPGKLTFSSAGGATTMYLGFAMFEAMAGIKLLHVPYNGAGPSILGAVAGQVDVLSSGYGSAAPYARSGQLRMLGISTAKPSALAPGVPTIAEAGGVPGYEIVNWIGVFAPAGTPRAIVDKLNATIGEIQKQQDVHDFMTSQGVEPMHLTPAKFNELVKSDIVKYQKIVKDNGVKIQ